MRHWLNGLLRRCAPRNDELEPQARVAVKEAHKYVGHVERYERQISLRVAIRLMELWKIKPEEFFSFDEVFEWK